MACSEYQEFDLQIFGKHFYAEDFKKLNKACWQIRGNKTGKFTEHSQKRTSWNGGRKRKLKESLS